MSSTFKILFYVRKNYLNKNGKAGVMIRVTLNGEVSQFSSKLDIEPELWDTKNGKVLGRSAQAMKMNALMENMRACITNIYREIENTEAHVTAEKVRNSFLGYTFKHQTLLTLFADHNENIKKLVGISKSKATAEKYDRTYRRLEDFMRLRYKISDIALREINHRFIVDFETYLRSDCRCSANTTAKFMQWFRKIIIMAKNNGWIFADPFANYKITLERVDRGYLTEEELRRLMQKKFSSSRLEHVKDIFVFACYTGLAYIDAKNLSTEDIRTSFDGSPWIMTKRVKTGIDVNVPLLKIPQMIVEKYKGKCPGGKILPVLSNQKMNEYLHEISDLCGIEKNLTFHVARHTFATSITLSKGVPMETVSKMLGHTHLATTQIYARITNTKIGTDMAALAEKLRGEETAFAI